MDYGSHLIVQYLLGWTTSSPPGPQNGIWFQVLFEFDINTRKQFLYVLRAKSTLTHHHSVCGLALLTFQHQRSPTPPKPSQWLHPKHCNKKSRLVVKKEDWVIILKLEIKRSRSNTVVIGFRYRKVLHSLFRWAKHSNSEWESDPF